MPIKAENKARYPKNWKSIRATILERDENRCKWCKVQNHTIIGRDIEGGTYMTWEGEVHNDKTGEYLGMAKGSEYPADKFTRIVLTIAHLDHTPENNAPENLAALCQKCHLSYDKQHHLKNSAETRHKKKAVADMFQGERA